MGGRTVRVTGGEGVEVEVEELAECPAAGQSQIDKLVKSLSPELQDEERRLREPLLKALGALDVAEQQVKVRAAHVGELLDAYEQIFKKNKANKGSITNFRAVLSALGVSKTRAYVCKTAYRICKIEGMLQAADDAKINLLETRQNKLCNRILHESTRDHGMSPEALLKYCQDAIERERKAGEAPTVTKAKGELPVRSGRATGTNYDAQIEVLKDEYRRRYVDENEADVAVKQIIIAALTAQLAKLPAKVAA